MVNLETGVFFLLEFLRSLRRGGRNRRHMSLLAKIQNREDLFQNLFFWPTKIRCHQNYLPPEWLRNRGSHFLSHQ